jgi:hypothetical protein
MPVDLEKLRQCVSDEVDNYVYPYSGREIGNPKSAEWIADQLRQMRSALIEPYWAAVGNEPCVIVADEAGTIVWPSAPKPMNTS